MSSVHNERCANRALQQHSEAHTRFSRKAEQAFAPRVIERHPSKKRRHRVLRFVRNLVRWLCGPQP